MNDIGRITVGGTGGIATEPRPPGGPAVGRTPLVPVVVPVCGIDRTLWLKLEGFNAYGSIKARTAFALVDSLERKGELRPGGAVIESTSGNLGIALAGICQHRGYRCTLVVDADTPDRSKALMAASGAEVVMVPPVPGGNPVAERLSTVRRLLRQRPGTVWTDQYASQANPEVHRRWTAPELVSGLGNTSPDAVVAAVSTGGTLVGLSAYFRKSHPATRIVAVDAVGSAATGGTPQPRPSKVPGLGSGRPSAFLRPNHWDLLFHLDDVHAAWACQTLRAATDITLGGSAGAAVLGAVLAALDDAALRNICVICPDMGDAYLNTVYSGLPPAPPEVGSFRGESLKALGSALRPRPAMYG